MARYPYRYHSTSRGPIEIEDMADKHLLNAYRRSQTDSEADQLVQECMKQEIDRRGLDPQYPNGKPPEPPPVDEEGL